MSVHDRIVDAIEQGNRPHIGEQSTNGTAPAATSWPAPMADAAFHGPAGTVVRAIEPHTEADPAAMLVTFLAAFGNVVGRGPHVRLGSAEHGPQLFVMVVGDTGAAGRKGTSWEEIKRPMRVAAPDWHPTGGIESGQGVIYHVRDPHDVRRKAKTKEEKLEADADGYVTVREDEGVDDKRLFLLESEFGKVLAVADRRDSTTVEVLKQPWDCGDARTLAKQAHTRTTGALVSVGGHITPTQLRSRLANVEIASGFANRFVFVCSQRSKELPDGDGAPDDLVRSLGDAIAELLPFARKIGRVELTPDARDLWRSEYGRLTALPAGAVGPVLARAAPNVQRFALAYALLDERPAIHLEHLQAALAVWDYCESSARYLFKDSTGDHVADMILDALRHRSLNRREIHELLHGNYNKDRIDQALTLLQVRGLARKTTDKTGGRPGERWHATERTP